MQFLASKPTIRSLLCGVVVVATRWTNRDVLTETHPIPLNFHYDERTFKFQRMNCGKQKIFSQFCRRVWHKSIAIFERIIPFYFRKTFKLVISSRQRNSFLRLLSLLELHHSQTLFVSVLDLRNNLLVRNSQMRFEI